jgi:hypothetical protein
MTIESTSQQVYYEGMSLEEMKDLLRRQGEALQKATEDNIKLKLALQIAAKEHLSNTSPFFEQQDIDSQIEFWMKVGDKK